MSDELFKLVDENYPIKPNHINTKQHLYNAFGKSEVETSAGYIVRLCQRKGNWIPFSQEEIQKFYEEARGKKEDFWFNGLDTGGVEGYNLPFVPKGEDGLYRITHGFVAKCFVHSPCLELKPQEQAE